MKIYIYVKNGEKFTGKNNKEYDVLYTIKRKLFGNMQLCGARINNKYKCIDLTLPTEIDKLPRDAKKVDNQEAEKIWTNESWGIYNIA